MSFLLCFIDALFEQLRCLHFQDQKEIHDVENTGRVQKKKGDEPNSLLSLTGVPKRQALPKQAPQCQQRERSKPEHHLLVEIVHMQRL